MKIKLFAFLLLFSCNLSAQNFQYPIDSLISEGNYYLALQNAKAWVETDSLNAYAWELLGQTNKLNHRYNEAVTAYRKASELNPSDKALLLTLAKTCNIAGNTTSALKVYTKILDLDSTNTAAKIGLSDLLLKAHRFKDAYSIFYDLYLSDSLNSEYVREMGYCKYKSGEILEAFDLYKKSYRLNPGNLKTVYWLADVYTNSNKPDSAINMLNTTIELYPENGRLYAKRGNAYLRKNHVFLSAADYKKAIELGYTGYLLQKNLGKSLFVARKYDEARKTLEKLIVRDTADYQVCMYLGKIYLKLNNNEKSLLFYQSAIDLLLPDSMTMSATYHGMAETYHAMGKYHQEIATIKKRAKYLSNRFPSNIFLLEIANIYEENLNDKKSALKYYQKYYNQIKGFESSYWEKEAEKTLAKINRLKEDIHFEK